MPSPFPDLQSALPARVEVLFDVRVPPATDLAIAGGPSCPAPRYAVADVPVGVFDFADPLGAAGGFLGHGGEEGALGSVRVNALPDPEDEDPDEPPDGGRHSPGFAGVKRILAHYPVAPVVDDGEVADPADLAEEDEERLKRVALRVARDYCLGRLLYWGDALYPGVTRRPPPGAGGAHDPSPFGGVPAADRLAYTWRRGEVSTRASGPSHAADHDELFLWPAGDGDDPGGAPEYVRHYDSVRREGDYLVFGYGDRPRYFDDTLGPECERGEERVVACCGPADTCYFRVCALCLGFPVEGATVDVYDWPTGTPEEDAVLIASLTTGADGCVTLTGLDCSLSGRIYYRVYKDGVGSNSGGGIPIFPDRDLGYVANLCTPDCDTCPEPPDCDELYLEDPLGNSITLTRGGPGEPFTACRTYSTTGRTYDPCEGEDNAWARYDPPEGGPGSVPVYFEHSGNSCSDLRIYVPAGRVCLYDDTVPGVTGRMIGSNCTENGIPVSLLPDRMLGLWGVTCSDLTEMVTNSYFFSVGPGRQGCCSPNSSSVRPLRYQCDGPRYVPCDALYERYAILDTYDCSVSPPRATYELSTTADNDELFGTSGCQIAPEEGYVFDAGEESILGEIFPGGGTFTIDWCVEGPGGGNEVQRLSANVASGAGNFAISHDGGLTNTGAIPYNATASQVQTALEGLATIGVGNVSTSGGPLPGIDIDIEFVGSLAGTNVAQLTAIDDFDPGFTGDYVITTVTEGG